MLEQVTRLYAIDVVLKELPFFLLSKVVSHQAAANLKSHWTSLVKQVAEKSDDILDCLNVPAHALYAPIAADYVKYNETDNQGEVIGARM